MKGRREKNKSFPRMSTSGRGVGTKKWGMGAYKVNVFCIHI
jgi:hypothetical protein